MERVGRGDGSGCIWIAETRSIIRNQPGLLVDHVQQGQADRNVAPYATSAALAAVPEEVFEHPAGDAAGLVTAVRAVARTELPRPARPVRYLIRATLPRTAAGKVARAELAATVTGNRP